jgi:cytochrome c
MSRSFWIHLAWTTLLALAMVFIVRSHMASGDVQSPGAGDGSSGYRLASAWCKECHAIEASAVSTGKSAPDFVAIANLPSTTELALKVFLLSGHNTMPNFIIKPGDADDLVAYILSLKRR